MGGFLLSATKGVCVCVVTIVSIRTSSQNKDIFSELKLGSI